MTDLIEAYGDHQRAGALSPKTIKRRTLTLRGFERLVGDLTAADTDDVIRFLNSKQSPKTKHAYRSDLMGFYDWAIKRGHVTTNPVADTATVKVKKAMPRPIGPEVATALLMGRKDTRRMVALGLFAGLRCAEIAGLDFADFVMHLEPPVLHVRSGKGGKDRVVPMHPELVAMFDRCPSAGPVFPGKRGGYVTPGSVSARISRHLRRCGIEAVPHQLRHTFGTEMTKAASGDLLSVATAMGHESMQTTRIYAGWSGAAAEIIARMYPKPDPPAAA